jgi:hypothetical protein
MATHIAHLRNDPSHYDNGLSLDKINWEQLDTFKKLSIKLQEWFCM